MLESVTTLIAALAGYVTRLATEWLHDRRADKREAEGREAERRLQLLERRANFQRETLLSLQDALMELNRATGKVQHLDVMEVRRTGQWRKQLLPADLDESAHQAMVKTLILMVRVRDNQIREMVEKYRDLAARTSLCHDQKESEELSKEMVRLLDPLNERIGEILRKLDEDEDVAMTGKTP